MSGGKYDLRRAFPRKSSNNMRQMGSRLVEELVKGASIDSTSVGLGKYAHSNGSKSGSIEIVRTSPGIGGSSASLTFNAYYDHAFQQITVHGSTEEIKRVAVFLADYKLK